MKIVIKVLIFIAVFLVSCKEDTTVEIPKEELDQVTSHLEDLIKRDSINQLIIEELKGQQTQSDSIWVAPDTTTKSKVSPSALPDLAKEVPQEESSLWLFILEGILLGFLALLMPCVYPMIPMTVSFFTKGSSSKSEGLRKALLYGLSIVLIYTSITIIPALIAGAGFAHTVSTHWLPNFIFFFIFMAFGFSFLGMYEIVLPSSWVNSVDRKADRGGNLGLFFMAFTLVLVSFSCTAPFVSHVMSQVTEGKLIYPVVGMLAYSITFALPFVIFALFPSLLKSMPKSGTWMNTMKTFLGFLEIGLALKFLSNIDLVYGLRILDRDVFIGIWIALSLVLGVYLLGLFRLPHDEEPAGKISIPRLFSAVLTFWFAIYLWPGLFGAPLNALSGVLPPMDHHDFDLPTMLQQQGLSMPNKGIAHGEEEPRYADHYKLPSPFQGYFEYEQALRVAKARKQPLFIDFTGKGCANCRKMEQNVWAKESVKNILMEKYTMVALYTDDRIVKLPPEQVYTNKKGERIEYLADKNKELEASFGDIAQPYYVLLDPFTEKPLVKPVGYTPDVNQYVSFLQSGLTAFNTLHP
ncbi:MAG: thioredoxin family protein [Cytophagaceae bacterium]|jgi:thiol:disulfide interchange protein DsbD|nr:thioredoxin family protein [Cytophagaceae bacterium]